MSGINFSMDGPIMDGTWYNTTTGDSFTVRDTFFQDNQLMVATTDGRLMDYNMIQNYIKSDKPINIPKQQKNNEIPIEVIELLESPTPQDPYMLEEDMALISNNHNVTPIPTVATSNNCITPKLYTDGVSRTEDQRLVERVLSRQQQPSISCDINWTKFPQKQMDVLMDMMGVDLEDVCDFYISKIDLNDIRESIKRDIKTYIETAMGYNGVDEQYVPDANNNFHEVVVTPFSQEESMIEVSGTVLPSSSSIVVTNDSSGLEFEEEFEEFPIERPEKSKKKTTKLTTKKTTKKK